jgi:CheY-like chemotaxis protein
MGERILREEGFEVVTVTDGRTAIMRLADVDPDVVFADASLPGQSGYEICRQIKKDPLHQHVRVILTAGLLEAFDENEAQTAGCDAILKKPFEASAVIETLRPLIESAARERGDRGPLPLPVHRLDMMSVEQSLSAADLDAAPSVQGAGPSEVDAERVRAAVTVAMDAALPSIIDSITEQVLVALGH